ncbi:MAG: rhamnosyltransferase [Algoriphagus sp.]|jgi:rhamnosyltransferase
MEYKVDVVIVTFYPDRDLLRKSLQILSNQVRTLIIVSNNDDDFSDWGMKIVHINLQENTGIASAQNQGIRLAMANGVDFVLTSDQDTIFPENYVEEMLHSFQNLLENGQKIGALSPVFRDAKYEEKIHPMVKFSGFGLKKFFSENEPQAVSHVISSGMFLNSKTLQDIGLMKESFFIDWVDTEWCWRADARGYSIYQIPEIFISHALGENSKDLILFSVTSHHYLREYYKLRNAIFLLKDRNYRQLNKMIYLSLFIVKNTLINSIKGWKEVRYFQAVKYSFKHGIRQEEGEFRF